MRLSQQWIRWFINKKTAQTGFFLRHPKSRTKIFCTMCPKWEIKRPEVCSNTLTSKGKKHFFFTRRCKDRFVKNSEKSAWVLCDLNLWVNPTLRSSPPLSTARTLDVIVPFGIKNGRQWKSGTSVKRRSLRRTSHVCLNGFVLGFMLEFLFTVMLIL